MQHNINNNYYDRYKDVENQINYENEQAEAIRQYNEQIARQKELDRIAQEQWEKEYAFQQQQLAYQKEQDAIANAQRWAQINAEKSYYANLTDNSSSTSGSDLSENSNSGSDAKLTNVKKSSPNLSSKNANNWYANNIDKLYFGGGLTESKLESIIDSGLSSGVINNKDVDKILSTFGL